MSPSRLGSGLGLGSGWDITHQRDRSAHSRLRRDVTDHDAVGRATEAAVCHERDVLTQAATDESTARHKHLGHA
eukprot:scaffold8926_cov69-Phaeocystis_antarctica.AAC.1